MSWFRHLQQILNQDRCPRSGHDYQEAYGMLSIEKLTAVKGRQEINYKIDQLLAAAKTRDDYLKAAKHAGEPTQEMLRVNPFFI